MATTVADRVFVDTNVLVYSRFPASPMCVPASIKLDELFRATVPVWASRQILREYASSLTKPQNYRIRPVPITDVIRDILHFESVLMIADETAIVTQRWLGLLAGPYLRRGVCEFAGPHCTGLRSSRAPASTGD